MISPHVVALAEAGALPDVTGVLILFALPGGGSVRRLEVPTCPRLYACSRLFCI